MTTILSEHSRGISNSLTLSNRFIVLKMTETYSVSTLQAVQLTLTKHFSVFYTSKQETRACIHIYRTRPLWKCTENPDDSLHHLLNLIKRITLLKGRELQRYVLIRHESYLKSNSGSFYIHDRLRGVGRYFLPLILDLFLSNEEYPQTPFK